uniref:WAP four-disulfide core domain protein 5-like isoform X2 n=1 Tax=Geotrypetes seraphini TaxID=260995 RepID=A0A6P8NI66_GEOSA|nr:WAP four-disulfide core domain protein 5-like isoform X2 [Geotrypetes seraphini]
MSSNPTAAPCDSGQIAEHFIAPDHPGSCPPDNARCAGPITSNCTDDSVCAANEKCCLNQCTNKCVSANLVKPGSCPLAKCASQYSKNTCSNDYDCVGNEKCCPSCGNNCYPPGPE